MTKPFSPAELIARINALLRRINSSHSNTIEFEDIAIDLNKHKVFRKGKKFTSVQLNISYLNILWKIKGVVFSRDSLLDKVWGHGIYVESRTVDTHIRRLRKAINIDGTKNYIRTVRSAGYSIDMSRKYKIVIFGATGFTGELCARFMSERYSDIPIAIAGRSAEKLEKIKKTNNISFPAIVADAFDVDALNKMCKDAEVCSFNSWALS